MPDKLSHFDSNFALTQFSGNNEMLLSILIKFVTQYQGFSTALLANEAAGEHEQIKVDVHTIKGVAGNLGMKALFQASKEFESVLGDGRPSQAQLQSYTQVLDDTFAAISQFQDSHETSTTAQTETSADTQNAKSLLLAALSRNEFIPEHNLEQWLNELALPSTASEELAQAIDDLDYERAIQLIG